MDEIIEKNNIGAVISYTEEDLELGINNLVDRKQDWEKISFNMENIGNKEYN